MRALALTILAAALLAACAPRPAVSPTAESDVRVDGVSVLGAWDAIGAPDQPDIDRDIRRGTLTRTLIFNPYNRVRLLGEDRREGSGLVTYDGRLQANRLTFEGLPGTATLRLRNANTLELTDPGGNRTVYRRR